MREYTLRQLMKDLRKLDTRWERLCAEMERQKEKNPLDYMTSDEISEKLVVPTYVIARTWLYMKYFGLPEAMRNKLEIKKNEKGD